MFIQTLESQATLEQKEKWLPKAASYEIIGTFAQTELGHGNYIFFMFLPGIVYLGLNIDVN